MSQLYFFILAIVLLFLLNRVIIIYMNRGYRKYLVVPSVVFIIFYAPFWYFRISDFVVAENEKQQHMLKQPVSTGVYSKKKPANVFNDLKDFEVKNPSEIKQHVKSNSERAILWLKLASIQLLLALYFVRKGTSKHPTNKNDFRFPAIIYSSLLLLNGIMLGIHYYLES